MNSDMKYGVSPSICRYTVAVHMPIHIRLMGVLHSLNKTKEGQKLVGNGIKFVRLSYLITKYIYILKERYNDA